MLDYRRGITWMRDHYDKLVAFTVMIVLSGSLLYLAVQIGMITTMKERFDREISEMRPQHEHATELDEAPFEAALTAVGQPFQLEQSDKPLLFPLARVWCTDCRLPIPYEAEVCPFCLKTQRPDPNKAADYDGDKDGMWDSWELAHKLNPLDAADASADPDADGFTNYEEFKGDPQTDPHDPADSPPIVVKLRLLSIDIDPFMLRFRGMMKRSDGSLRFQINLRGAGGTYFKALGESVEGFEVFRFDRKTRTVAGAAGPREEDASELILKRGDNLIRLEKGKEVQHEEYVARMLFVIEDREIAVRVEGTFELRGKMYQVIRIDSRQNHVLIRGLHDGKETVIGRLPGDGASSPAGEPARSKDSSGR